MFNCNYDIRVFTCWALTLGAHTQLLGCYSTSFVVPLYHKPQGAEKTVTMFVFTQFCKIPQLPCKPYLSKMESGKIMKKLQRLLQDPSISFPSYTHSSQNYTIDNPELSDSFNASKVTSLPSNMGHGEEERQNKTKHTSSIIIYVHLSSFIIIYPSSIIACPFLLHA